MGGKSSKEQTAKPKIVTRPEGQTKHIRLLVLHKEPEEPEMDAFCDAINTYPPPDSLDLDHSDNIKIIKVPDDGLLPESVKNDNTSWISEWLSQGHIILICLLTDCDLKTLISTEDNNRIIVFCFKTPKVNYPNSICIDVDFKTATTKSINSNLSDLATKIKGDGQ